MKNKIFSIIVIALLFALGTSLSGCSSSFWTFEKCFDCTQEPLVYQGTITAITGGNYIHSACVSWDLSQAFSTSGSFFAGGQFQIEVVTKNGEFCSPDDNSVYRIIMLNSPWDSGEEPVTFLPGSAFKKVN